MDINPRPSFLIQSLRAFGYSPALAVCDLIDNSLAARATEIQIVGSKIGEVPYIAIVDNGRGMTKDELEDAMRFGSSDPSDVRALTDYGRYGLGLKTASLSQCRKMTVISKKDGSISTLGWDIDRIIRMDRWDATADRNSVIDSFERRISIQRHGTVVLWQNLDQMLGRDPACSATRTNATLYDIFESLRAHIAKTYCEIIGENVEIEISETRIEPWDPFLLGKPGLVELSGEIVRYKGGMANVVPYVIPHASNLTPDDLATAECEEGLESLQGFYLFRNHRLLIAGGWMGLKGLRITEAGKHARVRIDIDNTQDQLWNLDVKKSYASIPETARKDLTRIAKSTIASSAQMYIHRGKQRQKKAGTSSEPIWIYRVSSGKPVMTINRKNGIISTALSRSALSSGDFASYLFAIENSLPWTKMVETIREYGTVISEASINQSSMIKDAMENIYVLMTEGGMAEREIIDIIIGQEPFSRYPLECQLFIERHGGCRNE